MNNAAHTPGDVNHKFLGAAGYEFCPTCGESLRGKRTLLETELLEALQGLRTWAATHGDADFEGSGENHRMIPEWANALAVIRKARG